MTRTRLLALSLCALVARPAFAIDVGFAEADITPKLGGKPYYLAGFGHDRPATEILDPMAVRAFVLRDGNRKVAIATADVVGLFLPSVERIRKNLPGYAFVLVSSTHNHHGPDTMGLWGPNMFTTGVNPDYLKLVETRTVEAIQAADKSLQAVSQPKIGTIKAPELLHDGRKPIVLHDDLVVLDLRPAGIAVQWNCHPETLDSKGPKVSSDFVDATVKAIKAKYGCPVAYMSGTLGGLMTSMHVDILDAKGVRLAEGSVEKTRRYGQLLSKRCDEAIAAAKPLALAPFEIRSRSVAFPVDNKLYQLGKKLGVFDRAMEKWTGDVNQPAVETKEISERMAVRSEVGYLRLGELDVAVIPGEIYPELVLGKVQDPPDPGADFPDAPIEPAIYAQLKGPHKMIVGLANDELGYIMPKRQWDEKPPFTYGATKAPYGEVNSCGPDTGPLICKVFAELVAGKRN